VGERIGEWRAMESQREPAPVALVVETPLLFEAGLESNYDATIAVIADEQVRAQRAGARGHEALDERTARQLTQAEKADRATYAVENSGTLRELEQELSGVLEKLTS
jgi:dephospho-CoA kinase